MNTGGIESYLRKCVVFGLVQLQTSGAPLRETMRCLCVYGVRTGRPTSVKVLTRNASRFGFVFNRRAVTNVLFVPL